MLWPIVVELITIWKVLNLVCHKKMKAFQFLVGALPWSYARGIRSRTKTVAVDFDTIYQTITGFGFSEAFGHTQQFYNLPTTVRQQVLDTLLSTSSGAGLTILRNIITTGLIEPSSPGSPGATRTYAWDRSEGEQVTARFPLSRLLSPKVRD
jgi:hypothetical protein